MSILVFGHKNPDTDTICSAIAYAELKNKLGKDVKAVRLGEVNEETAQKLMNSVRALIQQNDTQYQAAKELLK